MSGSIDARLLAEVEKERDEAIALLSWVVHCARGNLPPGPAAAVRDYFAVRGEPHWHGKEVRVRAWWTRPEKILRCEIVEMPARQWAAQKGWACGYEVRPLKGNPHTRCVLEERVEGCAGWMEPAP